MTHNQREESHTYHKNNTVRQYPKIVPPTHRNVPAGHYVTAAGVCRQLPKFNSDED